MQYLVFFILLLSFHFSDAQSISDCNCDITITSNYALPNNISNKTVCITGAYTYTHNIQLKNNTELCIGENIILTGTVSGNWGQDKTIKNYGAFVPNNPTVNALANVDFFNYGETTANINFNQGDAKVLYNYGIYNTNTSNFRSGSFFNYNGATSNISNSAVFGSSINFMNNGEINTTQNLTFESNLNIGGNYTVGGSATFNSSNLYLENAYFDVTGNVNIWGNVHLQTKASNQCSEIYFTNINQWHGQITANHGFLTMTSFPNTQNVTGNVSTTPCGETIWLGNNTDFNQLQNWSNGLPTDQKNVIIPETDKNPELVSGNFEMLDLTIEENSSLQITNEASLTIIGDLEINGNLDAEEGNFEFASTKTQSILVNGNANMFSLVVSSGKSVSISGSNHLNVHYLLSLQNNSDFITNDKLTLKCKFLTNNPYLEAFQVGQVGHTSGNIIGNVLVEQCYTGRRAFRMLGSSVNTVGSIRENWQENANAYNHNPNPGYGTHITGVGNNPDAYNGFDWQPSGNPSMFSFDNINQSWSTIPNTTSNLEAGQPYRLMLRGSRSVDVTVNSAEPNRTILRAFGNLHQGDKLITDLSSVSENFNLVANPYQSVVDLVQVYADSDNILPYFVIWDPTLGSRGAFAAINLNTLEISNNNSEISRFLLPQQAGYFITEDDGDAEIIFKESHKNPSKTVPVVLSENQHPFIQANVFSKALYQQNQKSSDGLHISFTQNGSDDLDHNDALKMSNLDENMARFHQGQLVSIESRSIPETYTELPLYIDTYTTDKYIFEIETGNFTGYELFLKDKYTQEQIALANGINTIEVDVDQNVNASIAFNRFSLIVNPVSLSTDTDEIRDFSIYPNPISANRLQIHSQILSGEDVAVHFYNTLGKIAKTIHTQFDASGKVDLTNLNMSSGLYIVKIESNLGKHITTKVIKE